MRKHKISLINIIAALVFTGGFYMGNIIMPPADTSSLAMSANASMMPETEHDVFFKNFAGIVSDVLPSASPKKEETEAPEQALPPAENNYTPNPPVLASGLQNKTEINNDSGYEINIDELLSVPPVMRKGDIQVLIMHTHTSEAYTPEGEDTYQTSDSFRNEDDTKNMVAVGEVMAQTLRERGIGVIHDKTYHDYPSYTGSYKRALETIEKNLAEYPSVTLVLDVHRDAMQNSNGEYMKTSATVNGEECAQALIIIGTDSGGLEHPMWRENLKYGLMLQGIMSEKYPSLARPLHLRSERFNGHAREGEMIIEIGTNGNTLKEAKKAAYYTADCIAALISSLESR